MHIFVSKYELFIYDSYKIFSLNNRSKLYTYNSKIHSLPLYWKYDNQSNFCLEKIINIL